MSTAFGLRSSWVYLVPGLLLIMAIAAVQAQESNPASHQVDHLVLGISDLDAGIEQLHSLTGVRPEYGGEHTGRGTHNALMSLGDGVYLEILAPQQGRELASTHDHLLTMTRLEPTRWAISTSDVAETSALLTRDGFRHEEPFPMSRNRPNGDTLKWQLMFINEPDIKSVPFFIEWGRDVVHPSRTSPAGCTLASLKVSDPEPERLSQLVRVLGVDAAVDSSGESIYEARLDCPNGEIVLGG